MEDNIKVYAQIDSNNIITQVDSSIFLFNVEGWVKIDEGQGDNYVHAQSNYFEKSLIDSKGKYNYKLVDNKPIELTEEEKEKLFPTKAPEPTQEDILRSKLIKDGMTMQLQQVQQQKVIANLLTQVASLSAQISKLGGTQ